MGPGFLSISPADSSTRRVMTTTSNRRTAPLFSRLESQEAEHCSRSLLSALFSDELSAGPRNADREQLNRPILARHNSMDIIVAMIVTTRKVHQLCL